MSIEAMKQALEALDAGPNAYLLMNTGGIANKLRQAIAEAEKQEHIRDATKMVEQEPVAWLDEYGNAFPLAAKQYSVVGKYWKPLYTHSQPNVPTSDMKQEPVAKTAKQRHEENT